MGALAGCSSSSSGLEEGTCSGSNAGLEEGTCSGSSAGLEGATCSGSSASGSPERAAEVNVSPEGAAEVNVSPSSLTKSKKPIARDKKPQLQKQVLAKATNKHRLAMPLTIEATCADT